MMSVAASNAAAQQHLDAPNPSADAGRNLHGMTYRPDVDGLRALAVLSVVFFHAGMGVHGGFVGVDVFFVISGFLITSLIIKDIDAGTFRMSDFWERRIRRIMPPLAVMVIATLAAGWYWLFPIHFKELGQSAVAQASLVSNIYFWRTSSYFAQDSELRPLLHTWSLAVEEQFYLFFPLVLLMLTRLSRRLVLPTLILVALASLSLCVYLTRTKPDASFYLLPTRAWELLMGAVIAIAPAPAFASRWKAESLTLGGLGMAFAAAFAFDSSTPFPGIAALLPCVGAALIIWSGSAHQTAVGKALSARPLVLVGLISYSLYLWHWPVLLFARYLLVDRPPVLLRATLLLVCLGLAWLSWKFVETPIRKRRILQSRSRLVWSAAAFTVAALAAGLAICRSDGLPARFPPMALQYAAGAGDFAFCNDMTLDDVRSGHFVELGSGDRSRPIDILVWGDSHAMAAMPAFDALCKQYNLRGVAATHVASAPLVGYTSSGRVALNDQSLAFSQGVIDFARKNGIRRVFLLAYWHYHEKNDHGTDKLRAGIIATVQALKGSDAAVWLVKDVPNYDWDVPKALAMDVLRHGGNGEQLGQPLREYQAKLASFNEMVDGLKGLTIVDAAPVLAGPDGVCRIGANGHAFYYDKNHLSTHGAMLLRPLFEPAFRQLAEPASTTRP